MYESKFAAQGLCRIGRKNATIESLPQGDILSSTATYVGSFSPPCAGPTSVPVRVTWGTAYPRETIEKSCRSKWGAEMETWCRAAPSLLRTPRYYILYTLLIIGCDLNTYREVTLERIVRAPVSKLGGVEALVNQLPQLNYQLLLDSLARGVMFGHC